jgi:hypothetical protein
MKNLSFVDLAPEMSRNPISGKNLGFMLELATFWNIQGKRILFFFLVQYTGTQGQESLETRVSKKHMVVLQDVLMQGLAWMACS